MESYEQISRLVAMKVLGAPLAEEEENTLNEWLQKNGNTESLKEIEKLQLAAQLLKLEQEGYGEKIAQRFSRRQQTYRRLVLYKRLSFWLCGTAATLFIAFAANFLLPKAEKADAGHSTAITITPGKMKATLTLADGRKFGITSADEKQVMRLIDSLHTIAGDQRQTTIRYNKLSVPKGGEFFHQLVDGTKIWLNSESELRFPETFHTGERLVYLKGEAYFEVAKDASHPFIVSTQRGDIRVYGTRFNITDYEKQPFSTVLVKGSIGFRLANGREVKLCPSERLEYHEGTDEIKVETVDVSIYTAWVNHYFIFHDQSLEEIMTTLGRWYNFNVIFSSDTLRNIKLSGRLYRYEDVRVLLQSYEQIAGIKFQIKDRNIIITK